MTLEEKITGTKATEAVEKSVRAVPEPQRGPVTPDVVKTLRQDPGLAEVAELAEHYV
jgi:hypothetical protein